MLKLIYIAGPMRGMPGWNYEAFDAAEVRLRAAGWHPINPARTSRALGYRPDEACEATHEAIYLRHVMAVDVASIVQCGAIALLPGWERSLGTAVELALAQFLRLSVLDAITLEPITPECCPWRSYRPGMMQPYKHAPQGALGRIDELADIAAGVPPVDTQRRLRGYAWVPCPSCEGKGCHLGAAPDRCNPECLMCGGTGHVHRPSGGGTY
jgi:hypothetical protein